MALCPSCGQRAGSTTPSNHLISQTGTGTGFKFTEYTGAALLYTIRQALHHYSNEGVWKRIQLNGMAKDYSWNTSAAEYAKLYEAARAARNLNAVPTSN